MKYIIKIDRKTIKKNPHAGSTTFYVAGHPYMEKHEDGSISYHSPVQTLHTLCPQPKFLYEYVPCDVKCDFCESEFDYTELLTEDYADYWYSDTVCPECHSPNCCEIEFENLEKDYEPENKQQD